MDNNKLTKNANKKSLSYRIGQIFVSLGAMAFIGSIGWFAFFLLGKMGGLFVFGIFLMIIGAMLCEDDKKAKLSNQDKYYSRGNIDE